MDFLSGMKQAKAMGVSVQDFTEIWKREMALKQAPDENLQREIKAMLNQLIRKQEHTINTQQEQFKQLQQNFLQLQQRHDQLEGRVLDQLGRAETALNNLTSVCSETVSKGGTGQEKSNNFITNELQQLKSDLVSEIVDKVHNTIKAVVHNEDSAYSDSFTTCELYDDSLENLDQECNGKHKENKDEISRNTSSSDWNHGSDHFTVDEITGTFPTTQSDTSAKKQTSEVRQVSSSKEVNAMRAMIHRELNSMVVQIEKLILRPLTSDDLIFKFSVRVQELLSYERNVMTNNLQEYTSALTDEISARIISLQKCLKYEIMRLEQSFANLDDKMDDNTSSNYSTKLEETASSEDMTQKRRKFIQKAYELEQPEDLKLEVVRLSDEIRTLKNLLMPELPNISCPMMRSSTSLDQETAEGETNEFYPHNFRRSAAEAEPFNGLPMSIKLIKFEPRNYKYLWHFRSVTKLFKLRKPLFAKLKGILEAYRLRLFAFFTGRKVDFALVGLCGNQDTELAWPVDVKVTVSALEPSTQETGLLPEMTMSKVETLQRPDLIDGQTKSQFLYYFRKSKLQPYIDPDDVLYFHVIIEIMD